MLTGAQYVLMEMDANVSVILLYAEADVLSAL